MFSKRHWVFQPYLSLSLQLAKLLISSLHFPADPLQFTFQFRLPTSTGLCTLIPTNERLSLEQVKNIC